MSLIITSKKLKAYEILRKNTLKLIKEKCKIKLVITAKFNNI